MIPFDFVYCRPNTLDEAVYAYKKLTASGKNVMYYAGGSEIITMCRSGSIRPGAVIDIKNVPECNVMKYSDYKLHIGAACTLNRIKEAHVFPLLSLACGRIADHTNQCRITLGGNLSGSIIYRETSLPLLVSDAEITLVGPDGRRTMPFTGVFDGRIHLLPGEFIVQVHIPSWALGARHAHIKKAANEKIDYPLVNVTGLWKDDFLRTAFSGVSSRPFRSEQVDLILNDASLSRAERAKRVCELIPVYSDVEGSGEYRLFVLQNTLCDLLEAWENGSI